MAYEYLIRLPSGETRELGRPNANGEGSDKAVYLVSNVVDANSDVYAPEIDWYLRNSTVDERRCLENVVTICDLRSTMFENRRDLEQSFSVGKRVAVISTKDETELVAELQNHGCTVAAGLIPDKIMALNGSIGNFVISHQNGSEDGKEACTTEADQLIWFGAPEELQYKRGVYDPEQSDVSQVVESLFDAHGTLLVSKTIRYDRSSCLYDGKRHEICSRCVDICPSLAITRLARERKLVFSDIDCIGCGRCTAVCPTGAAEYNVVPYSDSFERAIGFYREKVALIIPEQTDFDRLTLSLPAGVLPLAISGTEFLHEGYLLDLPRVTGMPIVIFDDDFTELQHALFALVNEVFLKIYKTPAIYPCRSSEELAVALDKLPEKPVFPGELPLKTGSKRRDISAHLKQLVGKEDYGVIQTSPLLAYGLVTIKAQNCTLCLSCTDACPTDALWPNSEDNSLRYNPSICTSCGYCVLTCPEQDCLSLVSNVLALSPIAFTDNVLARDEIFSCIECGVGIGPSKAIEKIAAKMQPHFTGDETRLRTLYCCPECKAKTMLSTLEP